VRGADNEKSDENGEDHYDENGDVFNHLLTIASQKTCCKQSSSMA
jgi:hypothetical protein